MKTLDDLSAKGQKAYFAINDMTQRAEEHVALRPYPSLTASQIVAAAQEHGETAVFEALKFLAEQEQEFDEILSLSEEELAERSDPADIQRLGKVLRAALAAHKKKPPSP